MHGHLNIKKKCFYFYFNLLISYFCSLCPQADVWFINLWSKHLLHFHYLFPCLQYCVHVYICMCAYICVCVCVCARARARARVY